LRTIHYLTAFFLAILDWVSKWLVLNHIGPVDEIQVIPGLFQLILAKNPGIAFSFFSEGESVYKTAVLTLFNLLGLSLIVFFGRTNLFRWRFAPYCFVSIMGGIIGNSGDRLVHGWVVDFLDVHLGGYHWPTFNLADSYITIGVLSLVAQELFLQKSEPASVPKG
jgi:signal peptidase II